MAVGVALAGCSASEAKPKATALQAVTPVPCVTAHDARGARAGDVALTLVGGESSVVIISNEIGQDACQWADVAGDLTKAGLGVAIYDYSTDTSYLRDLTAVLHYVRAHGAKHVTLLGASIGAMASVVVGAAASPQPDAVVSLSSEPTAVGSHYVEEAAPKLRVPTLYVAADFDTEPAQVIVDVKKLAPPGTATIIAAPGGAHGYALLFDADIRAKVIAFVEDHTPGANPPA
jgi:pimeloyl-ACP methyl ester carboxylesterase